MWEQVCEYVFTWFPGMDWVYSHLVPIVPKIGSMSTAKNYQIKQVYTESEQVIVWFCTYGPLDIYNSGETRFLKNLMINCAINDQTNTSEIPYDGTIS